MLKYWDNLECISGEEERDENKLCRVCTRAHSGYFPGCEHQINISPPSNIFAKDKGNTNLTRGKYHLVERRKSNIGGWDLE